MALTLAEYKKQTQDPLKAGVVQTYLDNAPFLNFMSFGDIPGGAITFNRETTLPDAGFRVINAAFTTSSGVLTQVTESLVIAGGKITVDRALQKMYGNERLATDQMMQLKSLARLMNLTFFKGDGTAGSFTGLQTRATEVIPNGTAALSLSNLRKAVKRCRGENKVIFCNEDMFLHLSDAVNDSTLGSQLRITDDEFGREITRFGGVQVIDCGEDVSKTTVLPFTEAAATTSIYVVSFNPEGVEGIQNGSILDYRPVTESHANEYDIEWLVNYILYNPEAVQRVSEITDVAVVK